MTAILILFVAAALGWSQPPPPAPSAAPTPAPATPAQPPSGAPAGTTDLPEVVVSKDDVVIDHSCRIKIDGGRVISDLNGNGVIHIVASGITVEFAPGTVLRAPFQYDPDNYSGIGVRIVGQKDVVLRGARARGYKLGILATKCPGLVVEDSEMTDLYRMHLRSTSEVEDQSDWLWPHDNDQREWATKYGAGICIEDSEHVTIRRCKAREVQNGLILDRVHESGVYDNDFSFLSGWGLAMWRSNRNLVSRNTLDYCIRGYSHGVYNRGQDSAGILLFEQCCDNLFAENSATHCGDGFFAFAGKEALGQKPVPSVPGGFDYAGRGCNSNLLIANDFSYAAAHGIEMTFSFDNRFIGNRLVGNAICGIWGGYSQRTVIQGNTIESNGPTGTGSGEGGGINIEHGAGNIIANNSFKQNSAGVSLWWDDDGDLLKSPWARVNHKGSADNTVAFNTFDADRTGLVLRATTGTRFAGNTMTAVPTPQKCDEQSPIVDTVEGVSDLWVSPPYTAMGEARPVGRASLGGREAIVMTEWGPWDHVVPLVRLVDRSEEGDVYEVYGAKEVILGQRSHKTKVTELPTSPPAAARFAVGGEAGVAHIYQLEIEVDGSKRTIKGTCVPTRWLVRVFPWTVDPRTDEAGWRAEADGPGSVRLTHSGQLKLHFGYDGPKAIEEWKSQAARLPGKDHYGMVAETAIRLARGKWRFTTTSDDGVRVTLDAQPKPLPPVHLAVIENWTHHGPTKNVREIVLQEAADAGILVEYFQIDGFAQLDLTIERIADR